MILFIPQIRETLFGRNQILDLLQTYYSPPLLHYSLLQKSAKLLLTFSLHCFSSSAHKFSQIGSNAWIILKMNIVSLIKHSQIVSQTLWGPCVFYSPQLHKANSILVNTIFSLGRRIFELTLGLRCWCFWVTPR